MVNFFIFFTHNLCGSLDPIKMKRMNLCTVHKNSVITRVSEESNHISHILFFKIEMETI